MPTRNKLPRVVYVMLVSVVSVIGWAAAVFAEEPGFAQVPMASAAGIDYWIVSTRACPQAMGELCTPEGFEYFRAFPDGTCIESGWSEFLAAVNPAGPVCFLVHGNIVTFEEAVTGGWHAVESLGAHQPSGMPATFVSFTWPSEEVVPLAISVDIQIKACRSDATAFYLASLIDCLPSAQKVSLVGYSHGARAVAGTLELFGGGAVGGRCLPQGASPSRPMRASLIAAAMDHHWLRPGERNGGAVCQTEALQVFYNCSDWALHYYPFRRPFSRHALGYTGLDDQDWQSLGMQASKVQEVDAAPFVGTNHNWLYYLRAPNIAGLLAPYVFF